MHADAKGNTLMTYLGTPPRQNLPTLALEELTSFARHYPITNWYFEEWLYGSFGLVTQTVGLAFALYVDCIKTELYQRGFVVLGLGQLLENLVESEAVAATMVLLSCFGTPLRVFLGHPYWRRLGVDLKRPLSRSGGIGDQAFHIDFVNADNPPDLVCLLCMRSDPLGGGASPIASLEGIEHELNPIIQEILSLPLYTYGEVRNLNGIGNDANPFSVLNLGAWWVYRYTGKLMDSILNDEMRVALQVIADILVSREVSFMLSRGDLLLLDQHRVTHGRRALGQGQHQVPEGERRLFLQSFLRYE